MSLNDFIKQLDDLLESATVRFNEAMDRIDRETLEAARIEFLGAKSGKLKSTQKNLGKVDKESKPQAGQRFNEVKQTIESLFQSALDTIEKSTATAGPETLDVTLPGRRPRLGHIHPITQTIDELKDIMGRLGFSAVEGPEIEDDWHNFEALNIPLAHPARDPLDNFYLSTAGGGTPGGGSQLLRSQTSTVQIRVMEQTKPPVRIVSLGRVYRPDEIDATHYAMFHQIEGLLVDENVTMADLKYVLRLFATSYLGEDVEIRFRPSFFPFTEPSVEVDMRWQDTWLEFGGAGMVDPNVLRSVGYDPEEVSGFAFGLGVERLCMRRHGINDIRYLYDSDTRFLSQF